MFGDWGFFNTHVHMFIRGHRCFPGAACLGLDISIVSIVSTHWTRDCNQLNDSYLLHQRPYWIVHSTVTPGWAKTTTSTESYWPAGVAWGWHSLGFSSYLFIICWSSHSQKWLHMQPPTATSVLKRDTLRIAYPLWCGYMLLNSLLVCDG